MIVINCQIVGRNNINDVQGCFLENRGVYKPREYLNLDESVVNDYMNLEGITLAVDTFINRIISTARIPWKRVSLERELGPASSHGSA